MGAQRIEALELLESLLVQALEDGIPPLISPAQQALLEAELCDGWEPHPQAGAR